MKDIKKELQLAPKFQIMDGVTYYTITQKDYEKYKKDSAKLKQFEECLDRIDTIIAIRLSFKDKVKDDEIIKKDIIEINDEINKVKGLL
jgi:hypothetical protein